VNRSIALLSVLFAVQIAITANLYWPDPELEVVQSIPLTLLPPSTIDEIHIADIHGNETRLRRGEFGWSLPELDNLPADDRKVSALLKIVSSSGHGAPVADSVAARQRFRVASYHYQRRLRIHSEGKVYDEIYLGTSPGFRRVHARNDETDAIYSIGFNTFDASAIGNDWLDRNIMQVDAPDLIEGPGFALVRDGAGWINQNGGLPEARELDALLRALAGLQVDGVANEDNQRSIAELESTLTLTVTVGSRRVVLDLFSLDADRYIFSSEHPVFFKLPAYDYDRLLGLDTALLRGFTSPPVNEEDNTAEENSNQPNITEMEQSQ